MTKKIMRFVILMTLTVLLCIPVGVMAAETAVNTVTTKDEYVVAVNNQSLQCTYQNEILRGVYFFIEEQEGEYYITSPVTAKSVLYYFDEEGNGTPYTGTKVVNVKYMGSSKTYYIKQGKAALGWQKIKGKKYYFDRTAANRGVLLKNKIAGTKKDGYYYVDKKGVQVTAAEIKLAVKFVNSHTQANWSQEKKLKACFNYLWKNYKYKRFYETPKASKMPSYAKYMLSKKKGNCYRYAASLAYIARVLGYDTRVAVGKISSAHGGMTPHGWTELKMANKWYMFDANMQRNHPKISSYKKTNKTYAYRHSCSKRYTMTITNGKVVWK